MTSAGTQPDEPVWAMHVRPRSQIDPGHDAWVVGEAPCVLVDFGVAPTYAQHKD